MTDEVNEVAALSHDLDQTALLSLVKQGKEAWNQWAGANPESTVDFSNITFEDSVSFVGFQFPAATTFGGATFTGDATFQEATFTGAATFHRVTFKAGAWFRETIFTADAWFREVTFTGATVFSGATFTGSTVFGGATFTGDAAFSKATLIGDAWFSEATFTGDATFHEATFKGNAGFRGATFKGNVDFQGATFTSATKFHGATFTGDAVFSGATFTGAAIFHGATFTGAVWFSGATFKSATVFLEATFLGTAIFSKATFKGDAVFHSATFTGAATFREATFKGDVWFGSIDIQIRIDFNSSSFHRIPDFQTAKNRDRIIVDNVVFTLPRPEARVPRIVFWLTGIQGLNTSIIAKIRQLRGIANDTHAIDAERDLTILERNAEVGVAWSGLKRFRSFRQLAHSVLTTLFSTPLLVLYRWTSNYGRSIKLPLFFLITTPLVWFCVHFKLYLVYGIPGRYLLSDKEFSAIKSITLFGAFPISATQRPAYTTAVEALSEGSASTGLPFALQISLTLQSITSLIFLFLIGLALRNFFRMK